MPENPNLAAFSILPVILVANSAFAEPEQLLVTASRLETTASKPSQTVQVFERDDIERLWAASAAEALRQTPGTNVIQQGGRGGDAALLLRGGEPNFTVVMIDGVQVNDPTNTRGGSYNIATLEQSQIQRAEVLLGTMSPVYGSDALSGVVNFITPDGSTGSGLNAELGTDGYASANAFFGEQTDDANVGFGLFATDDEGDVEGSDFETRGINGKVGWSLPGDGKATVSLGHQQTDTTSFPEDSGGPELAFLREVDTRSAEETRVGLNLLYPIAERWFSEVRASVYERDDTYVSPGIAPDGVVAVPPNEADSSFSRRQVTASLGHQLTDAVSVLAGAEWREETGDSIGSIDFGFPVPTDFEFERDTRSVSAEVNAATGAFIWQAGIRHDNPDDTQSNTSGRLGMIYALGDGNTELRVNWGSGFKAPSFFALANPVVGNPDLRSEEAQSIDASVRTRFAEGDAIFEFTVFRNDYKDLIDFDDDLFTNVNRDKVVTKGAESAIDWSISDTLNIRAHVTYLDAEIRSSDEPLRGRPEWRGGMIVDWQIAPDWRWVSSILSMDDFFESSVPTGDVELSGYTRVDTALTWQASDALQLGLSIDNLFDQEYEEAVGFPAAGIRMRAGIRYNF